LLLWPGTTDISLAEKIVYPNGVSTEQSRNLAIANRPHGMQDISSTTQQHEQDVMEASNSQFQLTVSAGLDKGSVFLAVSGGSERPPSMLSSGLVDT
jgi:hypothetical protein